MIIKHIVQYNTKNNINSEKYDKVNVKIIKKYNGKLILQDE